MNNLINMSDHEKVIFVTGINEADIESINSLSQLYPFAVFFTNNSEAEERFGYPVMNLWKGSYRINRFIGIDENNNTIQIGDHSVKLLFDYESGTIGLYDANKLEDLYLIQLTYQKPNGQSITINNINNIAKTAVINSVNNQFSLRIKFTSNINGNASEISNTLNIEPSTDFILNRKYKDAESFITNSNGSTSITNEYIYDIIVDTYKTNENGKSYSLISAYSSDKSKLIQLPLILNPIDYKILVNGNLMGDVIYLERDKHSRLDIIISPLATSYERRKLYVKITLNENDATILAYNQYNNGYNLGEIIDGIASFDIIPNKNSQLKIQLYYEDNLGVQEYIRLSRTKSIIITGVSNSVFWYAGYDNPSSISFNTNNMMEFDSNMAGKTVLYDWNDSVKNLNIIDNNNAKFYIAIPYNYENIIMPRWDAYTIENNINIYVDYRNAFTKYTEPVMINNTQYVVYESKFTGKFYGKIQ